MHLGFIIIVDFCVQVLNDFKIIVDLYNIFSIDFLLVCESMLKILYNLSTHPGPSLSMNSLSLTLPFLAVRKSAFPPYDAFCVSFSGFVAVFFK